jgi:endonuclease III
VRQFIYTPHGPVIQEQLKSEWELLVGAILLNQSRRTPAWDTALAKVLDAFPTPQALAGAGPELEEWIKPHGFSNTKAKRLRRMSEEFQSWDGEDPRTLYGCGQYAWDSWRIFHRGDRPNPEDVKDGVLGEWLRGGYRQN